MFLVKEITVLNYFYIFISKYLKILYWLKRKKLVKKKLIKKKKKFEKRLKKNFNRYIYFY